MDYTTSGKQKDVKKKSATREEERSRRASLQQKREIVP
jgi:hypothetical protein